MSAPDELLVVVGPTASGKTELAVRLAETCRGEIVNADSVQVYRDFDIGTGKPSAGQRARAPHHLIDYVSPLEALDAASWAEQAARAIADIRNRGATPIVCGGSFLWVRALIHGLAPAPPANAELRARHRVVSEGQGRAALHAELARVDPESAARLAPNDFVRVSRALEVFELTGLPISRWHAQHGFREQRFAARLVGIQTAPAELDARIAARTHAMLEAGWLDEVRRLVALGYAHTRAMGSVGYRQLLDAVQAGGAPDILRDELFDSIRRATRVFARRQRTWLRDQPVVWLERSLAERVSYAELLSRRSG